MKEKFARSLGVVLSFLLLLGLNPSCALAENGAPASVSEGTYSSQIFDEADILTDEEETALLQCMSQMSEYGNLVCYSTFLAEGEKASSYASSRYTELFGNEPGCLLIIDFGNGRLGISSTGTVKDATEPEFQNIINAVNENLADSYYRAYEAGFIKIITLVTDGAVVPEPFVFEDGSPVIGDGQALYVNPETNYGVYVYDAEGLLDEDEFSELAEFMKTDTEYGNVIFSSVHLDSSQDSERYAEDSYYQCCRNEPGVLLQIDMGNRYITLSCSTEMEKKLKDERDSIIDNCYEYASDSDYFSCARECFDEVYIVLNEGKIAHTMKNINNGILALILGLLVHFVIIFATTKKTGAMKNYLEGISEDIIVHRVSEYKGRTWTTRNDSYSGGGYSGGSYSSDSSSYSGSSSSSSSSSSSGGFSGGSSSHRF